MSGNIKVSKVGWIGGEKRKGGTGRISAKPIVEGAGLVDGRYVPISVDEDKIVISQTPEDYIVQKKDEGKS